MLKRIDNTKMGSSDLGWLQSKFHFSFADYYNSENVRFGKLRVINDDLIHPHTGFDMHPHRDMEIISYVVDGDLTHQDTMDNKKTISRGHVQYMSAGTGVWHSEHNLSDKMLRILQIWILPDKNGLQPAYGDYRYNWEDRKNKWLNVVSSQQGDAIIKINQDASIHVLELDKDNEIDFKVSEGRQAYLVQIEGSSQINDVTLLERDALEIVEEDITIKALTTSHFLLIELKKK